jgi:HEAT repeat protein
MALFNKADSLAAQLKRLETDEKLSPPEVAQILEQVAAAPGFAVEKHPWFFSHPNARVRELAVARCAGRKLPELADLLIRDMPGKPSLVRLDMARVVVQVGPERVTPSVGPLLHSARVEQREAALDLIAQTPKWQELLGHLKAALRDVESQVRQRAVRILARGLDNPTIFMLLRNHIGDEDAAVRKIVIQAFAARPTQDIVEPFFERLPLEEQEDRDAMVRALSQLARKHQAQVEDKIFPMLGDENPEMRDVAVRLLAEMPDRTRVLRAFLVHSRGLAIWLKERCTQAILKIADSIIEPLLTLMQDPDHEVRLQALMLAAGSRDARVIPFAKEIFLGSADWWIRSLAAEILGNFALDDVTRTLISKLDDPDLQYSVIHVLGKQQNALAAQALHRCLKEGAPGVRRTVVAALAASKAPQAVELVAGLALNDPDPGVREKAAAVLESFGERAHPFAAQLAARQREESKPASGEALDLQMANDTLNAR